MAKAYLVATSTSSNGCCGFIYAASAWWKKTYNGPPPPDIPICPTQDELEILKRWGCVSEDGTWQPEEVWHLPDVTHGKEPRHEEELPDAPENDRAGQPDLQGEVDRLNAEIQSMKNAHAKELKDLKDLHAEIVKTAKVDAAIEVIGVGSNQGITDPDLLEGLEGILTPGQIDGSETF
ncbi:uncharacterized protein J4E92_010527 [Alternaria infectoria]|uniref:uncharacterized protein n=1 Tax=Alternaria infectoria TaxID=45303 RepID=UPI00222076A1|nr:uncharacterized protein J4E92_010527 [Alternaria infectoria]KAI4909911.1 hypothetical protein J4E92_010527 [Alternaria infectoria]